MDFWKSYRPGYEVDYLNTIGNTVYLSFYDGQNHLVICFDKELHRFTKEIVTSDRVIGVLEEKKPCLVSIHEEKNKVPLLVISSIPTCKKVTMMNDESIAVGESKIKAVSYCRSNQPLL